MHDLHATILHLLGIDHERFSYRFQGLDVRLTGVEPARVVEGRPFLYDAVETSSNGEASCSSCHISGDVDRLSWDLGNPEGNLTPKGHSKLWQIGLLELWLQQHGTSGPAA